MSSTADRPRVDLYYSYRSPFSYLASARLYEWHKTEAVDIHVRPVWPIALRDPEMFSKANPKLPPYIFRDAERSAAFHGIPYRWPNPDPVTMTFAPFHVAEEQPLIERLSRLAVLAERRGASMAYTAEVGRLMWSGMVEDWSVGSHLADAVARARLDLADLDGDAAQDSAALDQVIADNQAALEAAGHWGVPTMVFEGEPFFGQDRIEMVKWRVDAWRVAQSTL